MSLSSTLLWSDSDDEDDEIISLLTWRSEQTQENLAKRGSTSSPLETSVRTPVNENLSGGKRCREDYEECKRMKATYAAAMMRREDNLFHLKFAEKRVQIALKSGCRETLKEWYSNLKDMQMRKVDKEHPQQTFDDLLSRRESTGSACGGPSDADHRTDEGEPGTEVAGSASGTGAASGAVSAAT